MELSGKAFEDHLVSLELMDKQIREMNGANFYLWDTALMCAKIVICAEEENKDSESYFMNKAYWLSLRLKFTDEQTINLAKEFLYTGIKHYDLKINGHFLFEIMTDYNYTYPEALLQSFLLGFDEDARMEYPYINGRPQNILNALLLKDNKTIIYGMIPPKIAMLSEVQIEEYSPDVFAAIKKNKVRPRMTDEEKEEMYKKLDALAAKVYKEDNK